MTSEEFLPLSSDPNPTSREVSPARGVVVADRLLYSIAVVTHAEPRRGTGTMLALLLIAAWATLLVGLLRLHLTGVRLALMPIATAAMTFLYTGLFITAHDAMHGVVAPRHRRLNDVIGWVCTLGYAMFDFRSLSRAHHAHHRAPASVDDPDYHAIGRPGFFAWYLRFLWHYVRVAQIVGLAVVFNVLHHGLGVPQANLFAFWFAPAVLAATQLFYFGTYLPHRAPPRGYRDAHRAESVPMPELVSLLTCFHFGGYHYEHHAHPSVPWWRLPTVARRREG